MDLNFDPDGSACGGLFGLPHSTSTAKLVVLPVAVECTTSSAGGTSAAPVAVLAASHQVDLCDPQTGDPWREGIAMAECPAWIQELDQAVRLDVRRAREGDLSALAAVNAAGERIAGHVERWTLDVLDNGQIPAVLGGDHSVPLGAFRAAASRYPGLGILHVDAHADLREAYEGFTHSHASIFFNALQLQDLGPVVQVGIRDFGHRELAMAENDPRVRQWTEQTIADHLDTGAPFKALAEKMVGDLPQHVWVSFDIDGLDPALCPGTGTPVPGGLSWREAMTLLQCLGNSGRRIVGFDLCEVGAGTWDANVGARLLYKLSGWAIASHRDNT
jgi:agmatinase